MPPVPRPLHPGLMLPPAQAVPETPPGWAVGPPDFVGVGAQKAGTTWWFSVLQSHPDVMHGRDVSGVTTAEKSHAELKEFYMAKEFHFFDHYGHVADVDPALYHRYFPRPPGGMAGEWTPRYMYDFWTPPMLHRAAPDTKLLVMLRDPVERFRSGLAHWVNWGFEPDAVIHNDQFNRGLYWHQLRHLTAYFDREQILVLQYERCLTDMVGEAKRTFEFLGLDAARWTPEESATPHPAGAAKPAVDIDETTLDAIRRAYRADAERLVADFPEVDGTLWPTTAG